jgi:hypothetical protein
LRERGECGVVLGLKGVGVRHGRVLGKRGGKKAEARWLRPEIEERSLYVERHPQTVITLSPAIVDRAGTARR